MNNSPNEFLLDILKLNAVKEENNIYIYSDSALQKTADKILHFFTLKTESINKQLSLIQQMDETINEINNLTDQIWRINNHGRKNKTK